MPDQEVAMHFPICGIDVQAAFDRQPIKKTPDGTFAYTTPLGVNVRGYDAGQDRSRGGSRPGLVRYIDDRPGNQRWIVQDLAVIVTQSVAAQG